MTEAQLVDEDDSLATKAAERELQKRIDALKSELTDAESALARLRGSEIAVPLLAPQKRGYLFRWLDRSISWTGSKWDLRFVTLEHGKLAYYGNHTETSPRYVLSLRGCAVRDEGFKPNKRYKQHRGANPPALEVPGAYFFVFSIYLREEENPKRHDPTQDDDTEVVPLLRFSTNSSAEQKQWLQLISETCAYCETDAFLQEIQRRDTEQTNMALALPETKSGTLPPLYFAPARPKARRKPSFSKLHAAQFRSASKNPNADQVTARTTKGYPPSKPMHRTAAPSYLSIEAATQNYRGFLNFGVIILVVSNVRLVMGSVKRHGFLPNIVGYLKSLGDIGKNDPWESFPFVSGFVLLCIFIAVSFGIEYLLSRKKVNETIGMTLHYTNVHGLLAFATWVVWNHVHQPALGIFMLMHATIVWMKLISYAHANQDYRLADPDRKKNALAMVENLDWQEERMVYPRNVTLANLAYFCVAPTLTYQMAFPKYPRVRLWKVAGILMRMIPIATFFMFVVAQFVSPNLAGLVQELEDNGGRYTIRMLAEYWLRLSIANSYLWVMMFYFYFHLWLNLCAELTRWGDRVFYKDWWNSSELGTYWRLWNLPVHYWLLRHFYFPLIRIKCPKSIAMVLVFVFSAVFHELLVSVPFHIVRPWSFLGMMGQIPLTWFTKWLSRRYPDGFIGNVIFWVTFCVVGQPMAILMYTVDYQYAHR